MDSKETKLDIKDRAQAALKELEDTIVDFVATTPGVSNIEIVRALGLESSHRGNQKNYLSWSIIGRLLASGRLAETTRPGGKKRVYVVPN